MRCAREVQCNKYTVLGSVGSGVLSRVWSILYGDTQYTVGARGASHMFGKVVVQPSPGLWVKSSRGRLLRFLLPDARQQD